MDNKDYSIDGFIFENIKEYKDALKEYNNIKYLEKKVDMNNAKLMLGAYDRLIDSDNFNTAIGVTYLYNLRTKLIENATINNEHIRDIPVDIKDKTNTRGYYKMKYEQEQGVNKNLQNEIKKAKKRGTEQRMVMIFLIFIVVVMFILTLNSDTIIYSNAKNDVIDEYVSWQNELEDKEKELQKREEKLGIVTENNKQ